jgi:urease accessory protein
MAESFLNRCPAGLTRRGVLITRIGLALGFASLLSKPAAAHTGTGLPGGWIAGFIHPFSGIDHLLAMISVGLWGAFLGRPLIYVLPVVFPAMMVVGAILGMLTMPLPPVEVGIAVSVLVLGGCIGLAIKAPSWAACLVVASFAVFHGYAHGKELPSAADPVSYSAGFVLATGLLHISGIALGFINDRPYGFIVTRSAGGLVAMCGVWFLYQAIKL